jgi:hypothetical protein
MIIFESLEKKEKICVDFFFSLYIFIYLLVLILIILNNSGLMAYTLMIL